MNLIARNDHAVGRDEKFLGFQAFLFYPPCRTLFHDFSVFASHSLCAFRMWPILNNFFESRFQFSSSLLNCLCILLSCLSIESLVSVIIIFISLGFCSSSAGSLPYGFQTHVVGCSLGRLFPFIPLYSGVNPRRQHPHLPTVGQHFSTLPFRDSVFP